MLPPPGKLLFRLLAGTTALAAVLVLLLAWRLYSGPISLRVLTPYLNDALSFGDTGVRAELQDTIVVWDEADKALRIRAIGMTLYDRTGAIAATVPEIELALSLQALLKGQIAPKSIDVTGISARIMRLPDGGLDFGFGSGEKSVEPGPGDSAAFLTMLMEGLGDTGAPDTALAYLTRVSVIGADIVLYDEQTQSLWHAPRSDLVLQKEREGIRGNLLLNLNFGGQVRPLRVNAFYQTQSERVDMNIVLDRLVPAELAPLAPELKSLAIANLPVSGTVSFAIGGDRHLSEIRLKLEGGKGTLVLPDLYTQPVPVDRALFNGALAADFSRLRVLEAVIESVGLRLAGEGNVGLAGGLSLDIDAGLTGLAVDRLLVYWPQAVAVQARTWIGENISGGRIPEAKLFARLTKEALASGKIGTEALRLDFSLAGVTLNYLRPMPKLTDISGTARLTAKRIDLFLPTGRVGDVAVTEGAVGVDGLDQRDQIATISFTAAGSSTDILKLLDHAPLGFVGKLGLKPESVGGTAVVRNRMTVPLENSLKLDDIGVDANAAMVNLSLPGLFNRFDLSEGALRLKVNPKGLQAEGNAKLNGVAVALNWSEEFAGAGPFASHYAVRGPVDEAGRKALGFDFPPYLGGTVQAELAIDSGASAGVRLKGHFDLLNARLEIADVGWRKVPGVAASGELDLTALPGQPMRIDRLSVKSADMEALASLRFDGDAFAHADLQKLKVPGTEVSGRIDRRDGGGLSMAFEGPRGDLRPALKENDNGPPNPAAPPVDLTLRLDEATLADKLTVKALATRFVSRAGRMRELDVAAKLPAAAGAMPADLTLTIRPEGARRKLELNAGDAGAMLHFLDIDQVRAGRMTVKAEMLDDQPGAPIKGRAQLTEFNIVNAPIMARLLAVGSFQGLGALLTGSGINFASADVPFTMTSETFRFDAARAHGSALGISVNGTVNRQTDALAVNGTLVPAYTVNSILGNIPLLGPLIVGREGEGVFGITWRIGGTIKDPDVLVNPLSVLAPGFLRRLFELSGSGGGNGSAPPGDDRDPSEMQR